jgi:drug/metabolite transporter (DMT)-like permease
VSGAALGLVLLSAFAHAAWNLFAKRAGGGGPPFVWLFTATSTALYLPVNVAVIVVQRPQLTAAQLGFIAGSSVLHLAYFLLLQRGYRVGDLSVVYPLARGTGPLLSTLAAIALLGERPTPLALAGGAAVVGGVVVLGLTGERDRQGGDRLAGAVYGLATGLFIAAYTLWDSHAVSTLGIPPLLYDWGGNIGRTLLLLPVGVRHLPEVRALWRAHRLEVLAVAALSPLAYILVLTALAIAPVSYVAPARELSIVIATLLGTRLLGEGRTRVRLAAAVVIAAGVAALALG